VCDAYACDDGRIAEDNGGFGEVMEESNSRAEEHRGYVDMDFIEEPSVEALLGVRLRPISSSRSFFQCGQAESE
jgi:hypothetical protein